MIAAMAAFSVEDAFVKAASEAVPIAQVLVIFGLGGVCVFAILVYGRGESLFTLDVVSRSMLVRVVFEIVGRLFYVLAIAFSSLSSATVILQATPLVVVAGASVVFGERVGWQRWAAIVIGLVGVVFIVRPGAQSFSLYSVLALVGVIGFAGRDLASRVAPKSLSPFVLGVYGFLAIVVAGLVYALWEARSFVMPDWNTVGSLFGAVLFGCVAYFSLMKAMRVGEVSAVTPFRYTRLLFGVALGVLLFDECLSLSMLIGCGLILLSGILIFWHSKRITKPDSC